MRASTFLPGSPGLSCGPGPCRFNAHHSRARSPPVDRRGKIMTDHDSGKLVNGGGTVAIESEKLKALRGLAAELDEILAVYLHGSHGTEYETPASDLDLAFVPMPGVKLDLMAELMLDAAFSRVVGSDRLDVTNLRSSSIVFQFQVLKKGTPLYVRDSELLADYVERVIKLYCDFEPDFRRICEDFDAGLKVRIP